MSCPLLNISVPTLFGAEQWQVFQILSPDYFFFRQMVPFREHQPPYILFREGQVFILPAVRQFRQDKEIQKTFIQLVRDLFGITAGDVVM